MRASLAACFSLAHFRPKQHRLSSVVTLRTFSRTAMSRHRRFWMCIWRATKKDDLGASDTLNSCRNRRQMLLDFEGQNFASEVNASLALLPCLGGSGKKPRLPKAPIMVLVSRSKRQINVSILERGSCQRAQGGRKSLTPTTAEKIESASGSLTSFKA